jgi:hypothetical protein
MATNDDQVELYKEICMLHADEIRVLREALTALLAAADEYSDASYARLGDEFVPYNSFVALKAARAVAAAAAVVERPDVH